MLPTSLIILGALGIVLVFAKASDGFFVSWALALLVLNIWLADGQRLKRRILKREDRGSGEASSGHGNPNPD